MGTKLVIEEIEKKLARTDLAPEVRKELMKKRELLLNKKDIKK